MNANPPNQVANPNASGPQIQVEAIFDYPVFHPNQKVRSRKISARKQPQNR